MTPNACHLAFKWLKHNTNLQIHTQYDPWNETFNSSKINDLPPNTRQIFSKPLNIAVHSAAVVCLSVCNLAQILKLSLFKVQQQQNWPPCLPPAYRFNTLYNVKKKVSWNAASIPVSIWMTSPPLSLSLRVTLLCTSKCTFRVPAQAQQSAGRTIQR